MASYRATHRTAVSVAAAAAFLLSTFVGGDARGAGQPSAPEGGAPAVSKEKPAADSTGRLTRHGVVVDFQVRPAEGRRDRGLVAGQQAEVRFTLQDEATGKPVRGITPGAWMDIGQPAPGSEEASQKSCKDRIALYLKGAVGMRPMIDLNGYYVLVLNREPSISVVDPLVSMVGQTSTLGTIPLKGAGSDWARSADRKRLYVSMPQAGEVAVVDVESFKVHRTIQAGPDPARVALQPDGRYLWVGNDARATDNSGVTVVDVETLEPAARLATGPGHHEIAFTADSRYAFVSNREAGTVTVVDVAAKRKIRDVSTGPMPIALAWSPLAGALYVADGRDGSVSVLDGNTHEVRARIALKPGLGPMRFTADGRFGMVVNPSDNAVYVFDAAENALVHALEVRDRPYQIALSPAFAYVRALDSERVTMINLSTLGKGRQPIVQGFAAGAAAPREAGALPLADSIAPLTGMAAVLVVSPADHTTYYYMEGMNAPMSNYRVRGAQARAVTVVDRSLVEVEPGVYAAKVRIPAAGRYDVAFMLDSPQILHCFSVEAKPDPQAKTDRAALKVEYPARDRTAAAGGTFPLRFTLRDLATGDPRTGLADVRVMYFLAPGRNRTEVRAREVGDGVYEALLPVAWPGAYYVHVAVPSEKVGFDDLPYFTMMVTGAAPPPKAKPKAGETE